MRCKRVDFDTALGDEEKEIWLPKDRISIELPVGYSSLGLVLSVFQCFLMTCRCQVPVHRAEDSRVSSWNSHAFREVCDAIQHASVWLLASMDWRAVRRSSGWMHPCGLKGALTSKHTEKKSVAKISRRCLVQVRQFWHRDRRRRKKPYSKLNKPCMQTR